MPITLCFTCDGCHTEEEGTTYLKRRFHGSNDLTYGWGEWKADAPQDVAPVGWISFDPNTGCCYCPKCWDEIVEGKADE